ncbi:MAG TPA: hotdog domain-containing protein [Thermoleophilaceae bacterium]
MTPAVGSAATLVHRVREQDLATAFANDLPVLATPVLLWLAEVAAMRAVEGDLEPGTMTVGAAHRARHLAATPRGLTVTIGARLVDVDGARLRFEVAGRDEADEVLAGEHDRFLVEAGRFRRRVRRKEGTLA